MTEFQSAAKCSISTNGANMEWLEKVKAARAEGSFEYAMATKINGAKRVWLI
jgi:hypothetical protein